MTARFLTVMVACGLVLAPPAGAQTFGATKIIHQERSLYRNIIVLEGKTHRCLTFGRASARQSCIDLTNPDRLVFSYTQRIFDAASRLRAPKRILIIGVGGGSLPMALHRRFPEAVIEAVELDPAVIDVARRYFMLRKDEKVNVYARDGRLFIRERIRLGIKYDAIILDAFDKDYIPEHMASTQFLSQVRAALLPDGLLLSNTFSGTSIQHHEEATYQIVFGQIYESRLNNGNRIIVAGKSAASIAAKLPDARAVPQSSARIFTDSFAPANALLVH